jgi:hypothetical protein
MSVEVNSHLAEINLPQTRFDNMLTALGRATETNAATEGDPEDEAPADKDEDDGVQPPSEGPPVSGSTGSPMVRISEITESTPSTSNPAATTTTRSILRGTTPSETTRRTTTEAADYQTNDDPSNKMILDKQRKLLICLGEDGQTKEFHVEDFVGLYPAWPIVEVAISPTGNAKEERMNMFVKCITALFGEILYVDDTACIGPLDITDDNEDNYITDKSKLPSVIVDT